MAPLTVRAVLLRAHDYGDTSRVLRFYTESAGLLSVMAKGVRRQGGKGATAISSFASGTLTAWVRAHRELQTMKDFHPVKQRLGIGRSVLRLAGASAAAELVLAHAQEEPHPALFSALESALDAMDEAAQPSVNGSALAGAWRIVDVLGFAPQLDPCVSCGAPLAREEVGRFDFGAGGVRCGRCAEGGAGPRIGPIARSHLASLLQGCVPERLDHSRQHAALLSDFVAYHVTQRPLRALEFLREALPAEQEG